MTSSLLKPIRSVAILALLGVAAAVAPSPTAYAEESPLATCPFDPNEVCEILHQTLCVEVMGTLECYDHNFPLPGIPAET